MRRESLTQRQQMIIEVIRFTIKTRGYPPSLREIGDAVGLSGPSGVHYQLQLLEDMGYIRRHGSNARAIQLVK